MANEPGAWIPVDTVELKTYDEALGEAKRQLDFNWKWNKPTGNCKTTAYIRCSKHDGCAVVYKASAIGSSFCIMVKGKHGATLSVKKRKNSKLTIEEEGAARLALDMGGTPGEVHVSLTKKKLKELKKDGKDPQSEKKEEGGLKGM